MVSHPSGLARTEQLAVHQRVIDIRKSSPDYQLGLTLREQGIFAELSKAKQEVWNNSNTIINDEEAVIGDIWRFFQRGTGSTAPSTLGFVNAASGFKRKALFTMPGENLETILDWALIRVDNKKIGDTGLQFSNRVSFIPSLLCYKGSSCPYLSSVMAWFFERYPRQICSRISILDPINSKSSNFMAIALVGAKSNTMGSRVP